MQVGSVYADGNGIVLFSPTALEAWNGEPISEGANIMSKFMETDAGDDVLARGAVVPVLAITSVGYEYLVRTTSDPNSFELDGYRLECTSDAFALDARQSLVIADLAVFVSWKSGVDWTEVVLASGFYRVTVNGWIKHNEIGHVVGAGYEFLCENVPSLPSLNPDTGLPMNMFPR